MMLIPVQKPSHCKKTRFFITVVLAVSAGFIYVASTWCETCETDSRYEPLHDTRVKKVWQQINCPLCICFLFLTRTEVSSSAVTSHLVVLKQITMYRYFPELWT